MPQNDDKYICFHGKRNNFITNNGTFFMVEHTNIFKQRIPFYYPLNMETGWEKSDYLSWFDIRFNFAIVSVFFEFTCSWMHFIFKFWNAYFFCIFTFIYLYSIFIFLNSYSSSYSIFIFLHHIHNWTAYFYVYSHLFIYILYSYS